MKKQYKRSIIATLITLSLPTFAYGVTVVSPEGSFFMPVINETTASINQDIENKLNDNSLHKNELVSTSSISSGIFIPQDSNGVDATNNNILLVSGTPSGLTHVYGGYCQNSTNNCAINDTQAVIRNGVINGDAVGAQGSPAYASQFSSTANGNIYLMGGSVGGDLEGASAFSHGGSVSATGNVYLTAGNVGRDITGAYSNSSFSSASSVGNVYLIGGTVGEDVFGAYADAYSSSSYALGNVYVMGGTVNEGVEGASSNSYSATATGNVYLTDGVVNGEVLGASASFSDSSYANTAVAIGNVYLTGGMVSGGVAGATSDSPYASATGNVYLTGGTVGEGIIGASIVEDDVSLISANAKGNVYIYGDVKLQDTGNGRMVWGGYLEVDNTPTYYNVFNDNLLSMGNVALTMDKLGNFATYNFYLNDYNKQVVNTNTGLLTVTDAIQNNNTVEDNGAGGVTITKNKSAVHLAGISGEGLVRDGDTITLIDASGSGVEFIQGDSDAESVNNIAGLFSTKTGDVEKDIQVGLVRKVDAHYTVDDINNKILVTIGNPLVSRSLSQRNVKPLAEARVAALQNTTRGADLLLSTMTDKKEVGTFTPIAAIDGGLNTYHSGSSVDSRDYRVMVGSRYQFFENLFAGIAVEYGRSNYDTNNHINGEKIDGNGHTYNYGISPFTKYMHDLDVGTVYADAAFRFGRTSTEFKSNDIVLGNGNRAHYKSNVNYMGGLVGGGYVYPLNNTSSFDSAVHYLYTRLGSDSIVLDGDKVDFKNSTSSRAQLKEQYNFKSSEQITLYLAGTYEYEFNGKGKASVSGISIDAPTVKGSTGILEAGIKALPTDNKDFKVNMGVKGYGGKRDGATANAAVEYNF
ncbi:autotransporter domain-containing protein [Orbaceae bacterium ESL0727]|nr:autotransporter domain-containing protein [Orbaceae bacterium ESL0727]